MIGTVRFVGLFNASIWMGAAIFAWAGASRVVASDAMAQLLTPKYYPYFSGVIAQMLAEKYWNLHLACSLIALLHIAAESLYFGKIMPKRWLGLLLLLLTLGIAEKAFVQPAIKRTHLAAYAVNRTAAERKTAGASYQNWSVVSGVFEFVSIFGLGFYLWRVFAPPESTRFLSSGIYRG